MSDPYTICHTCGLSRKYCCKTPHAIFIGIPEAIRIHQKTGLKYSDFIIYTSFSEEQFREAFVDLIPSGKTIALKRKQNNSCVFHTDDGCRIPYLKPSICTLFPFWYEQEIYKHTGTIELFVEERECDLIVRMSQFKTMDEKCRLVGCSEVAVKELIKKLFENVEIFKIFENLFEIKDLDTVFEIIEKQYNSIKETPSPSVFKVVPLEAK